MDLTTTFLPIRRNGGYLPIEDHGLIGDGETAALVGRDGVISWLCVPQFDSQPLFCCLLDSERGGHFRVAPEGLQASRQHYSGDTGVLTTEMRCAGGVVRITDVLTLRAGADLGEDAQHARRELLRIVDVLDGAVSLHIDLQARAGQHVEASGDGIVIRCSGRDDVCLHLDGDLQLDGLPATRQLRAGDRRYLLLNWNGAHRSRPSRDPQALLEQTLRAWQSWSDRIDYEGPYVASVRRSAITLKLLDHFENGAIIAAPTSSLPEAIGGTRNWDYRFAWIRDASFSTYALDCIGLYNEGSDFLAWVLDLVERDGHPSILYTVDGHPPPAEHVDRSLRGYRDSQPVRWGNAAARQLQNDVYGEILDCTYLWTRRGGTIRAPLWNRLQRLIEAARAKWNQPDRGIWEVRSTERPFTYSAALCQVAIDRGARLLERFGLPGPGAAWRRDAQAIRAAIIEQAWDPKLNAFTEHLGPGRLDASLLALPLRRVIEAGHPRMVATTAAIAHGLDAGGGLLYRYLPEESPDGLPGFEGAFLLCSFWLVDNLAQQGRLQEAHDLFESLCGRASPIGLLPEQIDPRDGSFLGNFPQAFSHVGLITSAAGLAYGRRRQPGKSRK